MYISILHLLDNIIYVEAFPGVYKLSGAVNGSNVDIVISKGDVLTFELSAEGHPFWIKTKDGAGQDNAVSSGISGVGQGAISGVLIWDTAQIDEGTYYYQCEYHAAMFGKIIVGSMEGTELV